MAAASVMEAREPLTLILGENRLDLNRPLLPTSAVKLMQRAKSDRIVRKSSSMRPSRNIDVTVAEELVRTPYSSKNVAGVARHDQAVQTDVHLPAESAISSVNIEPENTALLQLKIEAMTWAAMAKDDKIVSLEKRLKVALKIAMAEQERNAKLETSLQRSKAREAELEMELHDSKKQIEELADAEERLCVQLGDFEFEAVEEDQRHQSEIAALTDRLEAQETLISGFAEESKLVGKSLGGKSESDRAEILEARREERKARADSSAVAEQQLEASRKEMESLHAELRELKIETLTSQQQKRNLSKRLRRLEKERRQLLSKGASRSSRNRRHSQRKLEAEAAGGVIPVLEFEV